MYIITDVKVKYMPTIALVWERRNRSILFLDSYTVHKVVKCHLKVIALVVQSLNHVQLFATPLTIAHHTPLFLIIFQSLLKFISIELVTISNHLILCHPLLHLPSIFPSIRVFSNESVLCIRWPKC